MRCMSFLGGEALPVEINCVSRLVLDGEIGTPKGTGPPLLDACRPHHSTHSPGLHHEEVQDGRNSGRERSSLAAPPSASRLPLTPRRLDNVMSSRAAT